MSFVPRTITLATLASALLICLPASLRADKVYLVSGQTIEGEIFEQTTEYVRIRYDVTATIKDERLIQRSEILRVEKIPEDQKELTALKAEFPIADLKPSRYYSELKGRLMSFRNRFPESEHGEEIAKLVAVVNAERARIDEGFLKKDGAFVSPAEWEANRMDFESDNLLAEYKSKISTKKFSAGLRLFDKLEAEYQGTEALPKAIAFTLEKGLPSMEKEAQRIYDLGGVRNLEYLRLQRLDTPNSRKTLEAFDREKAKFKDLTAREKDGKIRWTSMSEFDRKSPGPIFTLINKETDRLTEIDLEKMTKANVAITAARRAIANGDHLATVGHLAKAELHGGDDGAIKAVRDTALGLKKNADDKDAQMASEAKDRDAGRNLLDRGGSEEDDNTIDDPTAGLKTALARNTGNADKPKSDPEPVAKTPTTTPAVPDKPAQRIANRPDPTPTPAVSSGGGGGGGMPLWQMLLFGVAGLLIVTTLAMKIFGIGGEGKGGGKSAKAED